MNYAKLALHYIGKIGPPLDFEEAGAIKNFARWLDVQTAYDFSNIFHELEKMRETGEPVKFGPKHYAPSRTFKIGCVPFVLHVDPTMPSDQIEFRMSNGHTVRVVNVQCSSPDSEGSDDATL